MKSTSPGSAPARTADPAKFRERRVTANGAPRASVDLQRLETLWFNTGTLCNIECRNCYMGSSPANDRLAYLTGAEVARFLDEAADLDLGTREIGFTGGEPFMNPELVSMLQDALGRGLRVLVLTNAMQPMMRPRTRSRLLELLEEHGPALHLRVSLDHYTATGHQEIRGPRSWDAALTGLRWLADHGFRHSVAGRRCWGEPESAVRAGYARLFAELGLPLDAKAPTDLVLFPEMDPTADVPEITVDCWGILGREPSQVMCARSRMVVKRREATSPSVVSCTLLPYDPRFELGAALADSLAPVWLNHPYCSSFCVLGGASCSSEG